jgi:prepilin peptidase CpaA
VSFLGWMALAGGLLALVAKLRGEKDYAYVPAILAGWLGCIGFELFLGRPIV